MQLRDSIGDNYRVKSDLPDNALCTEDLIAIKMWKWNTSITDDMENYLTSQVSIKTELGSLFCTEENEQFKIWCRTAQI